MPGEDLGKTRTLRFVPRTLCCQAVLNVYFTAYVPVVHFLLMELFSVALEVSKWLCHGHCESKIWNQPLLIPTLLSSHGEAFRAFCSLSEATTSSTFSASPWDAHDIRSHSTYHLLSKWRLWTYLNQETLHPFIRPSLKIRTTGELSPSTSRFWIHSACP